MNPGGVASQLANDICMSSHQGGDACVLQPGKTYQDFRPGEPLMPWLYAIARRVKVDRYRKTKSAREHEVLSEVLPEKASQEPPRQATPKISEMLQSLPESQREVLLMLKVSGLSLEEVARATGVSIGSVKQKAHRAYESLRKRLGGGE